MQTWSFWHLTRLVCLKWRVVNLSADVSGPVGFEQNNNVHIWLSFHLVILKPQVRLNYRKVRKDRGKITLITAEENTWRDGLWGQQSDKHPDLAFHLAIKVLCKCCLVGMPQQTGTECCLSPACEHCPLRWLLVFCVLHGLMGSSVVLGGGDWG